MLMGLSESQLNEWRAAIEARYGYTSEYSTPEVNLSSGQVEPIVRRIYELLEAERERNTMKAALATLVGFGR